MATRRKDERAVVETGEAAELTHNPFGALAGALGDAPSPTMQSRAADALASEANAQGAPGKSRGRLVLRREKKGRRGKTAIIVAGLQAQAQLGESDIAGLAKQLRQSLGCGGSVERAADDMEIVVQGDQPARVAALLRAAGFRVDGVTS